MVDNAIGFRGTGNVNMVAPVGVPEKSLTFIHKAHALLVQADRSEGADRFEYAFQAGLRCAGAIIADVQAQKAGSAQKRSRRARQSGSAWVELRNVAPEFAEWAEKFEGYSLLRNDIRLGMTVLLPESRVSELHDLSIQFLQEVEARLGVLPAAA